MLHQRKNDKKAVRCSVETTLDAIGGRWKVLVIFHLLEGTKRFGELTRLLDGVSARTLTRQLRELETVGIITRYVHQQIPPKVDYSVTELGQKLAPILQAMHNWGEEVEKSRTQANLKSSHPKSSHPKSSHPKT